MTGAIKPDTVLRRRYRILGLVGQGGGGAVYRAEDLRLPGRITAIKELRPEQGESVAMREQARDQFRREASTLARLDHPGLPKVSDFFADGSCDYLVMDFVEGPDLRQVLEEASLADEFLAEDKVLGWAAQLLDIVRYLHAHAPPVLHRDIKPANIKLADGGRIKLVDFGLVKPLDPMDPRTLTVARGLGSLPYTPLEQYAGDTGHTDARTDIYGIGATLYHLLTRRAPVTAQERFLLPTALQRPKRLNPELSARVEGAILAAMALHPEKRPATVEDLRSLLLGTSPIVLDTELGTAPAAWRSALWENAALMALVGLLTLLAALATLDSVRWQAANLGSEGGAATEGAGGGR